MHITSNLIRSYAIAGLFGIPMVTALVTPAGVPTRDFDATWFALAMLLWLAGLVLLCVGKFRQDDREEQAQTRRLEVYQLGADQALLTAVRAIQNCTPDLTPEDREALIRRAWERVAKETLPPAAAHQK